MKLTTKRLILRSFEKKDTKEIQKILNNINVTKWLLVFPCPFTKRDATKFIKRYVSGWKEKPISSYRFAIERRDDGVLIGGIMLSHVNLDQKIGMLSYWLGEEHQGRGYGSEALKEVLNLAFKKLKLRRIDAEVYPDNPSSGKLLEKFGAQKEGYKRKAHICKADGKIKDAIVYGLLKEDWKK